MRLNGIGKYHNKFSHRKPELIAALINKFSVCRLDTLLCGFAKCVKSATANISVLHLLRVLANALVNLAETDQV